MNVALNIRLNYAMALVLDVIGLNGAEVYWENIYHDLISLAFEKGPSAEMPIYFQGIPALEETWHQHMQFMLEREEMRNCRGCVESHGNPCLVHG